MPSFFLQVRAPSGHLLRDGNRYPSFAAAAGVGRSLYTWGQFHVECPDGYIPSRSEQLLITVRPSKLSKAQQRLDSL
jgi:hypothetical protein